MFAIWALIGIYLVIGVLVFTLFWAALEEDCFPFVQEMARWQRIAVRVAVLLLWPIYFAVYFAELLCFDFVVIVQEMWRELIK